MEAYTAFRSSVCQDRLDPQWRDKVKQLRRAAKHSDILLHRILPRQAGQKGWFSPHYYVALVLVPRWIEHFTAPWFFGLGRSVCAITFC